MQRKPLARAQLRGKRIARGPHEVEDLAAQLAELLLGQVFARGIDGREVCGLDLSFEVVGGDGEAVAVRTPPKPDFDSGLQSLLEPGLVEPGRLDLARVVGDLRGENLQSPPAPARRRADNALDRGFLVAEEVGDPLRRNGLLVSSRALEEEVTYALDADPGKPPSNRRPDTLERLDGNLEPRRARRARGRWPLLRLVQAGEAGMEPHWSSRPLHRRPL